jgi:hypothetical protein
MISRQFVSVSSCIRFDPFLFFESLLEFLADLIETVEVPMLDREYHPYDIVFPFGSVVIEQIPYSPRQFG